MGAYCPESMDIHAKIDELTPYLPPPTRNGLLYDRMRYAWMVRALVYLNVNRHVAVDAVVDHFGLLPPDVARTTLLRRFKELLTYDKWLPELKAKLDPSENFTI